MPAAENTAGLRRQVARSCDTKRLTLPDSQSLVPVAASCVSTLWLVPYLQAIDKLGTLLLCCTVAPGKGLLCLDIYVNLARAR
jgi:hypothetical protein